MYTSSSPDGEHGAEFVYGYDGALRRLLRDVGLRRALRLVREWCWFCFNGRYATGSFEEVARELLPRPSAERVVRLLKLAGRVGETGQYPPDEGQTRWLLNYLGKDRAATQFIDMLLAGETCASLAHVRAKEGLGSLSSEACHRIAGGAGVVVKRLETRLKRGGARFVMGSAVEDLRQGVGGVTLEWRKGRRRLSRTFDGVIVTTPDGSPCNSRGATAHYHTYISVLLAFPRPWWRGHLADAMECGLYTDGPLNYVVQVHGEPSRPNVLRVLLPNARKMLTWPDAKIITHCLEALHKLSPLCPRRPRGSVKKWPFGLPCRGLNRVPTSKNRIVLAGDRFGEWPSMNSAASSGSDAAAIMTRILSESRALHVKKRLKARKNKATS